MAYTTKELAALRRSNPQLLAQHRKCRKCQLWFQARNLVRHTKACKGKAPPPQQ